MGALSKFFDRLARSDELPVVRRRGLRQRALTMYFPLSAEQTITVIPLKSVGARQFQLHAPPAAHDGVDAGWSINLTGDDRSLILATFKKEDAAREALAAVHKGVSPSRWRWVWRGLIVILVVRLLTPSAPDMALPNLQAPSAPGAFQAPAPRVLPQGPAGATPAPAIPAPGAEQDPFGLKLSPAK